jgi:glycosyltransferase involved in cell wall biosynthesis
MKRKKILFVAAHRPDRSPSQRFRFEQYLSYLKDNGFDYDFSWLISAKDDRKFYSPGNIFTKFFILLKSYFKRWKDVWRSKDYDIIFVQREAFMTGSTFFERRFKRSGAKLVFDFDDAIWNLDVSEGNKRFGWLKNPGKTAELIAISDLVIAGNQYLADYARRHSNKIVIVPTTIDMKEYQRPAQKAETSDDIVCIGWSGSITTIKHFEFALPFLRILKKKYGDRLHIKVIGDGSYVNEELNVQGLPWKKETEIAELCAFDIGIMPLPDDEWAKGKCGLKGLQYMALGIPTIMSPVGVNTFIIEDGKNGMLASETDEWVEKLTTLIESAQLRKDMGRNAEQSVRDGYSVDHWKGEYLRLFTGLAKGK